MTKAIAIFCSRFLGATLLTGLVGQMVFGWSLNFDVRGSILVVLPSQQKKKFLHIALLLWPNYTSENKRNYLNLTRSWNNQQFAMRLYGIGGHLVWNVQFFQRKPFESEWSVGLNALLKCWSPFRIIVINLSNYYVFNMCHFLQIKQHRRKHSMKWSRQSPEMSSQKLDLSLILVPENLTYLFLF